MLANLHPDRIGIDIDAEELMSVASACAHPCLRHLSGKPCAAAKIYRLFDGGIRGIRLESVRVPGGLRTSREAVARFISGLNADDPSRSIHTSVSVRRAQAAVDRQLILQR